jgi:trimeric autotransporter adhesin
MIKAVRPRTLLTGFSLSLVLTLAAMLLSCASDYKLTSVTVSPETATLGLSGTTMQFTASGYYARSKHSPKISDVTSQVTWASSDTNVATISASGVATAVNIGQTIITASLEGFSGNANLSVTVGPRALTAITIIPSSGSQVLFASGETAQFLAIGTFNGAPTTEEVTNTVTWQSTDVDVATINASGLATAENCAATCVTNIIAKSTQTDGSVVIGQSNLTLGPSTGAFLPTLTVYPVGQGTGTIVSTPVGISCGGLGVSCSANFAQSSTVTITATATSGVVLGFSSNCAPTATIPPNGAATASCNVSMGGNQTVGVIFNQ